MESSTFTQLDSIKQLGPDGQEYWSARDLCAILSLYKSERFEDTIKCAMAMAEQTGNSIPAHFAESIKLVVTGKGRVRKVKDYTLSRFACYLIAQKGDSEKPETLDVQIYFAPAGCKNEI